MFYCCTYFFKPAFQNQCQWSGIYTQQPLVNVSEIKSQAKQAKIICSGSLLSRWLCLCILFRLDIDCPRALSNLEVSLHSRCWCCSHVCACTHAHTPMILRSLHSQVSFALGTMVCYFFLLKTSPMPLGRLTPVHSVSISFHLSSNNIKLSSLTSSEDLSQLSWRICKLIN